MSVTFPLYPDDVSFSSDNRSLMNNRQIFTRAPERAEEESLMRYGTISDLPTSSRHLPQGQRQRYNSVKRPMSAPQDAEPVNTYEKFYKKSAAEEAREKAKRIIQDKPRQPKPYVYPLERTKQVSLHKKVEEKPVITEERMQEYQKRKAKNVSDTHTYDEPLVETPSKQGDLFNREDSDYFKKKHGSVFDREGREG